MDRKTTTTLRAKNNKAITLARVRAFQKVIYGHWGAVCFAQEKVI